MKNALWLTVVALSAFPAGFAASDAIAQDNALTVVPLTAAKRNAGHNAQATLAAQGNETAITLLIGRLPDEVLAPPHIYTYLYRGTCSSRSATPAADLNRSVLPNNLYGIDGVSALSRRSPIPLSTLREGGYALVVRTSQADGNFDLFCGDIRAT